MSDTPNAATSGAESETSGSDETILKTPTSGGSDEVVKLREHNEKLRREKDNAIKRNRELEAEREASTRKDLEEKQQFKTLYEQERQKRQDLEEQQNQARINSALRDEFLKRGLMSEHLDTAFKLVDRKGLVVDPETKTVVNADAIVGEFQKQHASLGFFKRQSLGVSHESPRGGVAKTDLSKMSYQEKIEFWKKNKSM